MSRDPIGRVICPESNCTSPMTKRQNTQTRDWFYGCMFWPDCKVTRPITLAELLREAGAVELDLFREEEEA